MSLTLRSVLSKNAKHFYAEGDIGLPGGSCVETFLSLQI